MNMAEAGVAAPEQETETSVRLRGVEMTYSTQSGELVALERMGLEIKRGEFVSIVGPSGCGKTTLLKLTAGLLQPTAGSVEVRGPSQRALQEQIGIVFQSPVLPPWSTVLDCVLLPIKVFGLPRSRYEQRARDLLEMVGLRGMEPKYPFELSGGMQQRVAIARALVYEPDVLLMDEPFSALDAMTREQLFLELRSIYQITRKTVIFITHSIQEAVFLGTRMLVMTPRPGRVAMDIPIELPEERGLDMLNSRELGDYVHRARQCLQG